MNANSLIAQNIVLIISILLLAYVIKPLNKLLRNMSHLRGNILYIMDGSLLAYVNSRDILWQKCLYIGMQTDNGERQ